MIAIVRKNLTRSILKHTSPAPRSPFCSSFFLHFSSTPSEISPAVFDILRHKYQFPPELATRVASELSHLKTPEKADSVLSFLKQNGFSSTDLERTVKYRPWTLASNLEDTIKPKFKVFRELGFSSKDISRIISRSPTILGLSVNDNIIPSFSVLKGLLGSDKAVAGVVRRSRLFLTVNLENSVVPNVEFLKNYGIPMDRIRLILKALPNIFLIKPEVMRKCVEKAKEMGFDSSSRNFVYAVSTIASMSNEAWERKLQALRKLGFSDSEILTMFKKAPQSLCVSVEKMKELKELLLATGKYDLSCILDSPQLFSYSIEKRFKPRLQILGVLESRNLIQRWPCLATFCPLTDDQFLKRYIRPYLNEIGDVYVAKGKKGDETLRSWCLKHYDGKISEGGGIASAVASDLARLKSPENEDSILSFLKEIGCSTTQLEKIVKYEPRILLHSVDDVKLKIKTFQDLGLSPNDIAKMISSNQVILHLSAKSNIIPSLSVLKGLLGSDYGVARLLKKSAWPFANVELLKSCGISMERLLFLLYSYPRCFLVKPETMRKSVEKAKETGFSQNSKIFIYALQILAFMSKGTWEAKLQFFSGYWVFTQ